MRQIQARILRMTLKKQLENLPFEIIKHGKVVALVSKGNIQNQSEDQKQIVLLKSYILELEKKLKNNSLPNYPILPNAEVDPEALVSLTRAVTSGRCQVPFCKLEGPYRQDWEVWNDTIGEMTHKPGFVCNRHYLKK